MVFASFAASARSASTRFAARRYPSVRASAEMPSSFATSLAEIPVIQPAALSAPPRIPLAKKPPPRAPPNIDIPISVIISPNCLSVIPNPSVIMFSPIVCEPSCKVSGNTSLTIILRKNPSRAIKRLKPLKPANSRPPSITPA